MIAANHDSNSNSNSAAAITGNILGAIHGTQAIPVEWLDQLELRDKIGQLVEDWLQLVDTHKQIDWQGGDPAARRWWERHQGA